MKMIINGIKCDSSDGKTMEVINPATMEVIDTIPKATEEDVNRALDAAVKAKKGWKNVALYKRVELLWKFTELVEANSQKLAEIMCREIGKPIAGCEDEVAACVNIFRGYCEKARNYGGKTMPLNSEPRVDGDLIANIREPLGVVASILPFNYPTELFAHKVAPALVVGNVVVIKPAADTPLGNIFLTELLHEAGIPGDVVQIVTGSGATMGNWLSSSPKIDAVSLTGSTNVGIITAGNAANNLTHVFLELGGNDPLIVFDDADVDQAVTEALAGRVGNSGQTCCGTKRFIIQRGIKDVFVKKLVAALEQVKVGDPFDRATNMGPLISEYAAKDVEAQVQKTIEQGAALVFGGHRYNHTFFEPTVLDNVTKDMDIAGEMEIFGPVFPIIAFDTCEEALEIANNCPYGLSSGVMTGDMKVAMKVAKEIEAGTCVINGCGNYRSAHLPFGGYKMTGIGREGVTETLDEYTQIKNIAFKKLF